MFGALLSRDELLVLCSRVVTEVVPVTALYRQFLLGLSLVHTFLDTVVDTRSICNDSRTDPDMPLPQRLP